MKRPGWSVFDAATVQPKNGRAGEPGVREFPPYNAEYEAIYKSHIELVKLQQWVQAGEVVLSTDEAHRVGDRVAAGEVIDIAPRSMLVLREA